MTDQPKQGVYTEKAGSPATPPAGTVRFEDHPAPPPQHFYEVVTNGYGMMYGFAARVSPRDRWAIVAYVKALQASQDAPLAEAPPEVQARLGQDRLGREPAP